MEIQVDVDNIVVEVRCKDCGEALHIYDQYEYYGKLTMNVGKCEECEE